MEQAAAILAAQGMTQADIAEAVGKSIRTVERWHAKAAFKAVVAARVNKAIEPTTALLDAQKLLIDQGAPQAAKVLIAVAKQTEPLFPVDDDRITNAHALFGDNCVLDDPAHAGMCARYTTNAMRAAEVLAKGTGLFVSEKAQQGGQAAAAVIIVTPEDIAAARRTYIDVGGNDGEEA